MQVLAGPRQQEIIDIIQKTKHVVVSQLAKELLVSEMTIRRDLKILEKQGLVVRIHGGAMSVDEARFAKRLSIYAKHKSQAAAKLSKFIPKNGSIYLDGSTTNLSLLTYLSKSIGLSVATNNVETFKKLSLIENVEPLLLGGRLDRRTDNLVGPLAIKTIESLAFEAAFFSAWGLEESIGPNEVTVEDAEIKQKVAERSKNIYLAVDCSKLGVIANGVWGVEKSKMILATNLSPSDSKIIPFKNKFSEIL